MKLYRIDTGGCAHFARSKKHLKRAIRQLEQEYQEHGGSCHGLTRKDFRVDVVHFDISAQGIIDALHAGCEAAGGHEDGDFYIFGYGDQ